MEPPKARNERRVNLLRSRNEIVAVGPTVPGTLADRLAEARQIPREEARRLYWEQDVFQAEARIYLQSLVGSPSLILLNVHGRGAELDVVASILRHPASNVLSLNLGEIQNVDSTTGIALLEGMAASKAMFAFVDTALEGHLNLLLASEKGKEAVSKHLDYRALQQAAIVSNGKGKISLLRGILRLNREKPAALATLRSNAFWLRTEGQSWLSPEALLRRWKADRPEFYRAHFGVLEL